MGTAPLSRQVSKHYPPLVVGFDSGQSGCSYTRQVWEALLAV